MKGVPIVAFRTGGIPLQIRDGRDGYLVDCGDIDGVVDRLYALTTDKALHERISSSTRDASFEPRLVGSMCVSWLWLCKRLVEGETGDTGARAVVDAWHDDPWLMKDAGDGADSE
jgi:glycosyltransferase involved in cell wall biosynthesis